MQKLIKSNILSEKTVDLILDCNTFLMMVADETLEKKK